MALTVKPAPLLDFRKALPVDEWELLPPLPEVIEAVNTFTRHYFQLGFVPKTLFPARLEREHRSVSPFLLLSLLSISARFTSSLTHRFGSGVKAAEIFMERAEQLALSKIYDQPSLESCQAFYLLSIAQQGSGWKNSSYVCFLFSSSSPSSPPFSWATWLAELGPHGRDHDYLTSWEYRSTWAYQ